MRSYDPNNEDDRNDAANILAEPWMLDLLQLNPSYTAWGPYEDYMCRRGADEPPDELGRKGQVSWESRQLIKTWADFSLLFKLDCLNECANFYFAVRRESENCTTCDGTGYHPDALWVSESFYGTTTPFRSQTYRENDVNMAMACFTGRLPKSRLGGLTFPLPEVLRRYGEPFAQFCNDMRDGDGCWHDKITQDEVDALIASERLHDFTHDFIVGTGWRPKPDVQVAAKQVNDLQAKHGFASHDAINRMVLIRRRLERLGLPHNCPTCEGDGCVYTAPAAEVSLTLWWLHPRKGCSRGIEIARIEQAELPQVYAFLAEAAERNASRFAAVVAKAAEGSAAS